MTQAESKITKVKIEGLIAESAKTSFVRKFFFPRFFLLPFAILLFSPVHIFAQDEPPIDEDLAPPPLKIISKAEKTSLDVETDVSDRTKLSLELMETRLKKAEDLYARNMLPEMFGELGGFHALMDDTLKYLGKNNDGRGKVLNNYKRLELSLRKFAPRIELIRRELPAKYEPYVRSLIKNVRAARTKAVEPLFDDSVVPNQKGS